MVYFFDSLSLLIKNDKNTPTEQEHAKIPQQSAELLQTICITLKKCMFAERKCLCQR